jgi:hypothetical protein
VARHSHGDRAPAASATRCPPHKLEQFIDEYLAAAGIRDDGKTGVLTDKPISRIDAYRMVRRPTAEARFKVKLGCHVFRATRIPPTSKLAARWKMRRSWRRMRARARPPLRPALATEITLDEGEWSRSETRLQAHTRHN